MSYIQDTDGKMDFQSFKKVFICGLTSVLPKKSFIYGLTSGLLTGVRVGVTFLPSMLLNPRKSS